MRKRISKVAATAGMVAGIVIVGGSVFGGIALASGHDDSPQPASTASTDSPPPADDSDESPSADDRDDDGTVRPDSTTSPGVANAGRSDEGDGQSCDKDDADDANEAADTTRDDPTSGPDDDVTNDRERDGCDPASDSRD